MNFRRPRRRQVLALLTLFGLCAPSPSLAAESGPRPSARAARAARAAQAAESFAAHPIYFDYPAGWAVRQERSNPQFPGFVIARAGLDAQIMVYVAQNEVTAAAGDVPTLLEGARGGLLLPLVEQILQPLSAAGANVQRSRATADIGGVSAAGDRWLVSAAGDAATMEAYLLVLGNHLVMVIMYHPQNGAAQFAPAWDLFRRTVSVGRAAGAAPPPGRPAAASPTPPANLPSLAAMESAQKVLDEMYALTQQAVKLHGEGKSAEALPAAERALALAEQADKVNTLPPEMRVSFVPGALNILGVISRAAGNYERAEASLVRSIALTEKEKGADDPSLAPALNNLAQVYLERGDYAKAETMFKRSVAIYEKSKGADDPATATALNNLAQFYDTVNDYARAEPLMQRVLALRERALGPAHPDVAVSLNNLGALYDALGDPDRAEQAYKRALAIQEKALAPDHPDAATTIGNLGLLYQRKGDTLRAEQLYQQSLAIKEKALGPRHPDIAPVLDNLGNLYLERGDYARAESMYKRALAIFEQSFGPDSADAAKPLNNLAQVYQAQRNYRQAEPLLQRALSIFEKRFGPEHLDVATALDNLAVLYRYEQQYERAAPLFARALALREKIAGPESAEVAVSLNNIGSLNVSQNNPARSLDLYRRALRIYEKIYGPDHPNVSLFLSNLSSAYYDLNDPARAVEFMVRANDIRERQLGLLLGVGSEEQKRLFVATLVEENDYTTSLHADAAPSDAAALRLALTTVLRRKGRVLDAMSDQMGALRRHLAPADRALLQQLTAARAELASLVLRGPGKGAPAEYQSRVKGLTEKVDQLESQVSTRSAQYRAQAQPVTLEGVQRATPAGAALVEFTLYRPYNAKAKTWAERYGPPRYLAYVLRPEGPPVWVSLGAAAPIDAAVTAWRAALANPRRADARSLARAADELVMRPVRKALGDTRRLFVSPDGALNLIPFGALVDEQQRYLVEDYSITYLTSGRDLLRLTAKTESRQGALVLADPSFDLGATRAGAGPADGASAAQGRRSLDFTGALFSRLPGTEGEARALGATVPGVKVLTGAQASESALKAVSGPVVLHVATHGFFLPDKPRADLALTRGATPGDAATVGENPLLRSGLALAGANSRRAADGEDGVLTAYEAAALDLWGTKLVVLSACETGIGEIANGEGVYGLRRALVLAGSESQVMSLWQVSDDATRDLMIDYYKRLQAGEGRTEALRQVQLSMLRSGAQAAAGGQRGLAGQTGQPAAAAGDRSHPFYWASFIQSGEWRGLKL